MLYYCTYDTSIGALSLISNGTALTNIIFGGDISGSSAHRGEDDIISTAYRQISEYLRGERRTFTIAAAPEGTNFQLSVWRALQAVPYGERRTYGDIARAVGLPGGARAVGGANHRNPLPIIIPCHRVVASNGIGGYGGGVDIKRALLTIESSAQNQEPTNNI
ncbi:MAG: methylated-DNA--[protein]-cysteine S-methyltransferase [Eubacteriales bacterium]